VSHYDTLGVSREASADEIKQAFRRRSSQCHPDKGGSADEMAQINRAYETLSDEARRAEYDATGASTEPGSVQAEARDALITLFRASIENSDGDHVADVRSMLSMHRNGLEMARLEATNKRARLMRRRRKVRVLAGENLVHALIDEQVAALDRQLAGMPRGFEVNRLALEMLGNYEMTEETLGALISGWKAGT
jgi:curved DNA-binding protein CbpA